MTLVEIPTPASSAGRRRVPWHRVQITEKCWLWTGPVWKGYGKSGGTTAHRHVWLALGRTIPTGLELDHLCRVPLCVNPDHLEPVTRAENARRRALALVTCINGHDYTPENTYTRPDGTRDCRICIRARVAKYRRTRRTHASSTSVSGVGAGLGKLLVCEREITASVLSFPVPLRPGEGGFTLSQPVADASNELRVSSLHARTLSGVTR